MKYENDGSEVHHDLKLVYFGDDKHNPLYSTFEKAASHNHDAYEFITTESSCASTYGAQANGIVAIRNFNEPYTVYHKGNDPLKLAKWMSYLAIPHYSHMDESLSHLLFDETRGRHVMFLISNDHKKDEHVTQAFKEGANDFQGDLVFSQTDTNNEHDHVGQILGLNSETDVFPQLWIVTPTSYGAIKYKYSGDATQLHKDDVKRFATEFQAGNVQPSYKGIPES